MAITLFVAGDVVPQNRTLPLFKDKQTNYLFGNIMSHINCDINIVNFESPIVCGDSNPIKKSGPSLKTTAETLETLKNAGFDTITLANNHFRDYGQRGVEDTLDVASKLKINIVGAGKTLIEARKYFVKQINGKSVAIINACENEFSIATDNYGGSNPIDLVNMYEDITDARSHADYVILILHGGIEHYQYPTPRMKKWYHHFIDIGADAVINHHQHCFSGYELYKGKPIFYGLGNFCFEGFKPFTESTPWNYGYAVKLILEEKISFELIPYIQCADEPCVKLRDIEDFRSEIEKLNEEIADDKILFQKLKEYTLTKPKSKLWSIMPWKNSLLQKLFYHNLLPEAYSGLSAYAFKNQLTCESHLEVLQKFFMQKTNE